jgi:hypothetical protein
MKGKLVLLAALAALAGIALVAGAVPLTWYGATGYGTVPSANVIPSMSATGQYSYVDTESGFSIWNVGAGWNNLEVTYTKFDDVWNNDDLFSAKYQLDLTQYDPEFDLPIKLAVGLGDLFDDFWARSWYVVGTYTYELGAPLIGDVIPTLEFSLGTGNEMFDDVFYAVKADLGDFAAWYESLDTGESDRAWNWGAEYNPSTLPGLTLGYSDVWETDVYTATYNLAF